MYRRLICAIGAFCLAHSALAQDLDINLDGDTVQFVFSNAITKHSPHNNTAVNASALFTSRGDFLLGTGLKLNGQAGTGSPGLVVGMGAKLFGGRIKSKGAMALALDGSAQYNPPPLPRLAIGAELYYAPGILSFIDATSLLQAVMRVGYEVLPDSYVYIGLRTIRVGISGRSSKTVDSGLLAGLNIHF